MKEWIALFVVATVGIFCIVFSAQAKPPTHCDNCECRELRLIRKLLENQFHVICDESHCEGSSSSSSNGSSLP